MKTKVGFWDYCKLRARQLRVTPHRAHQMLRGSGLKVCGRHWHLFVRVELSAAELAMLADLKPAKVKRCDCGEVATVRNQGAWVCSECARRENERHALVSGGPVDPLRKYLWAFAEVSSGAMIQRQYGDEFKFFNR